MSWLNEGQLTGTSKQQSNGLHIPKHVGNMVLVTVHVVVFEPDNGTKAISDCPA